jgi:hypothetical protein
LRLDLGRQRPEIRFNIPVARGQPPGLKQHPDRSALLAGPRISRPEVEEQIWIGHPLIDELTVTLDRGTPIPARIGDSGNAHSSAGDCDRLGAQNTCPGYPVRGEGIAGIETSLKRCLDQMWDEGEPPVPIDQCIDDYQNCFLPHGHWINMQSTSSQVVSCGFYEMPNGSYWMNQDFGR